MKKVSAKKLRELLADVRAHNEGQLFKPVLPEPPVISYRKSDRHQFARWVVARSGYKTDPEHGHFLDGHNKVFPVTAATTRVGQFIRAREWASEKYGYTIDEWEKTPFGSWAPKTALDAALWHYLPELFEESTSAGDPTVARIVEKMYGDDADEPQTTTVYIPPTQLPDVRPLSEVIQHVSSVKTDGWYRVVGANVAVFIQATSEHDAKNRVEHMINRMTMDGGGVLYTTKRDPEVS